MINNEDMTITLKRIEVCDLLLACTLADMSTEESNKKWANLHDKVEKLLEQFDREYFEKNILPCSIEIIEE